MRQFLRSIVLTRGKTSAEGKTFAPTERRQHILMVAPFEMIMRAPALYANALHPSRSNMGQGISTGLEGIIEERP